VLKADGKHRTAFRILLTALSSSLLHGVSLISDEPALVVTLGTTERLLIFGSRAWRKWISFRRRTGQGTRLLAGFVERLVDGVGDGVDGGIGLHDERLVDGNVSRHPTRNGHSRDTTTVLAATRIGCRNCSAFAAKLSTSLPRRLICHAASGDQTLVTVTPGVRRVVGRSDQKGFQPKEPGKAERDACL
jgi:hypothetical protein